MGFRKVKMSESSICYRKRIDEFPQPYNYNFSPHSKFNFEEATRHQCLDRGVLLSLKVCKIIILGDLCVGKTSLLNRFCYKVFETDYKSTIGVDFQTEEIDILGVPYHLQIWDTAGQERFKCIAQCYYRRAHVIMLVFDLSSIWTIANCKKWLRDALEVSSDTELPHIFLVGSKKDLLSEEACKNVEELANKTAIALKAELWSVSAKTGDNIEKLFFRAAALAFEDDLRIAYSDISRNRIQIGTELISFKKNAKKTRKRNKCEGVNCATKVHSKQSELK